MKRTYHLAQTLENAQTIQKELLSGGVKSDSIHMLCKNDDQLASFGLNQLPLSQRRDIMADIEYGTLSGVLVGVVIAIVLIGAPAGTIDLTPIVFTSISFSFAFVGLVIGGLLGLGRENYHISEFRGQLSDKQCVVMTDTDGADEGKIAQILSKSAVDLKFLKEEDDEMHLDKIMDEIASKG